MCPEIIDQIVICTKDGQEHPIPLFPDITVSALKRKVKHVVDSHGIKGRINVRWNCSEELSETYQKLIAEVWPDAEMKPLPPLEPGKHPADGRMEFKVSDHYFRALAKIAFHYYLATSKRATGGEAEFDPIRNFIINGGNIQEFFVDKKRFVRPVLPQGMVP